MLSILIPILTPKPLFFSKTSVQNGESARLRMRDCIATTVLEELYGNHWLELGMTPHEFAYARRRAVFGYANPDDPRVRRIDLNIERDTTNSKLKTN